MAIVNLDKVHASYNGNLESLKFATDQTNGVFAHVGDLVAGEREVKNAVQPTESTVENEEVVLLAAPELMYDERKYRLEDFTLKAGVAGRAYHLVKGDIVSLTEDLFNSTPVVGEYVVSMYGSWNLEPSADGTVLASDGTTSLTPAFKAEVIEQGTLTVRPFMQFK